MNDYEAVVERYWADQIIQIKTCPVPLCPQQIPHGLGILSFPNLLGME